MYNLSKTAPFGIKTTEAMHYRRYIAQRMKAEHGRRTQNEGAKAVAFRTAGVSDGKGFVFVSHTGRDLPQRLPAGKRRQRAEQFADGCLPELRPVPAAARYQPSGEASAAFANTRRSAAARGRAPTR